VGRRKKGYSYYFFLEEKSSRFAGEREKEREEREALLPVSAHRRLKEGTASFLTSFRGENRPQAVFSQNPEGEEGKEKGKDYHIPTLKIQAGKKEKGVSFALPREGEKEARLLITERPLPGILFPKKKKKKKKTSSKVVRKKEDLQPLQSTASVLLDQKKKGKGGGKEEGFLWGGGGFWGFIL